MLILHFMMKFWKWNLPLQNNRLKFLLNRTRDLRAIMPAVFFLAAIIFQTSCRKSENILGLGVQPPDDRINALYSVTEVQTRTIEADTIRTDEAIYNLAGSYNDPVFGKSTASFYSQFRLVSNNVSFGDPATNQLDSVVLSLKYKSTYGKLGPQTLRVYEISESILRENIYFSNSNIAYFPNEIGNIVNFTPNIYDSVNVGGATIAPHLRIKLDNVWGEKFLNAPASDLANNENFLNFFKGIYVKPDTNNNIIDDGMIISFDLLSNVSKITLYYTDTIQKSFDFVINENSARINQFQHNYGGTEVAAQLSNPASNQEKVYVQSMGGVNTKIILPDLSALFNDKTIVINKAELVIPVEDNYGIYSPPARQDVIAIDNQGKQLFIADFFEGSEHYNGTFNAESKEYRFNIGRHLLFVLRENFNYTLQLLPAGAAANANRVVLKGGAAADKKMNIQITYTKL